MSKLKKRNTNKSLKAAGRIGKAARMGQTQRTKSRRPV